MDWGKPLKESIKEYTRGIIGGLLFSFPLLYTMEVWWAGYTVEYSSLLVLVVIAFIVLLGYNRYAGMHPGVNWKHIAIESIEEMGIGLLVAFIVLLLLNRITLTAAIPEIVGKVVIEGMMVSIGVSVGTAQMGSSTNGESKEEDDIEEQGKPSRRRGKLALVILSLCGSVLVSSSVAPTDEVWMLAIESKPYHVLLICLFSITVTMVTGYFSNFKGTDRSEMKPTAKDIIFVTCLCYISSLVVSAFLLWFFGRFQNVNFQNVLSSIVILGAIASLGGSAGRLLIK